MNYFNDGKNHIVIKRHKMIMFFTVLKVIVLLEICFFLYSLDGFIQSHSEQNGLLSLSFLSFLIIIGVLHYAFYIIITITIKYFNNVIIIGESTITVIKCSLLLKDDIEVIDCYRVTKVDAYTHGFIPNLLQYGHIVIEQHINELRTLRYIPYPYKLMNIIKEQRAKILREKVID